MYYTLTKNGISIILEGTEQVLALRAKISVDKPDITNVSWHEAFKDWDSLLIRMPGSYLPNWVMAGSYWTEEGWDFVFAKKPKGMLQPLLHNVLVIETNKNRYKRLIIGMNRINAKEIISWWKSKK